MNMRPAPRPARCRPVGPDWLEQVFAARAAREGGVIRRQIADVHREVGREALELEVRRRGFHLLRSERHYLIVCSAAPLEVIC